MRNRMLVLLCLLVPTMSMSGWFDWGSKDEAKPSATPAGRRYVLKIPNKAAEQVYQAIRRDGHQHNVIETMQTREELYERIGYHAYEQHLDALFANRKS